MKAPLHRHDLETPLGRLTVHTLEGAVVAAQLDGREEWTQRHLSRRYADCSVLDAEPDPALARAVSDYFDGDTEALERVETSPRGTDFQRRVWRELRGIPVGETRSYGELAAAIGRPRAFRAVAQANRANPIAILVPCHRVLGQDGSLTGYAGRSPEGLARKAWLLEHERSAVGGLRLAARSPYSGPPGSRTSASERTTSCRERRPSK